MHLKVKFLFQIIKEGIKAVEFDVMLTADKVPVVFHDDSLIRMVDSGEMVKNVDWGDLRELDLSKKHPFGFVLLRFIVFLIIFFKGNYVLGKKFRQWKNSSNCVWKAIRVC